MPKPLKKSKDVAAPVAKKTAPKRNKLYTMPEKISEGTVLTDLTKTQWCIGKSIGSGGFGEIYSACRVGEKNFDYVVKCEPHGNGPLFVEMHFYMRNAKLEDIERFKRKRGLKSFGMPYMIGNGSADINGQKHRFIVMPRYSTDISKHYKANGDRLPEGTIYRLALQMLDVYEFVHLCGYVHADLKAANILLGYGKGGDAQAYLVDYGLASHYTTKEFKPDPKKMHNGTVEYTSRDAHQGVATMRADLEILGYNIIEWMGVKLPWVKNNLLSVPIKVQKAKEDFFLDLDESLKKLFPKGVPMAIADYMKDVSRLEYNETPNYEKYRKIFLNGLKILKIANSGNLDFKIKATTNNNTSPSTSKPKTKNLKNVSVNMDASEDLICASDDDDDDVLFEKKKPVKVAPTKPQKTTNKKILKTTPVRKLLKTTKQTPSPPKRKITPLKTIKKHSPIKNKILSNRNTPNSSYNESPISVASCTPSPRKPIHTETTKNPTNTDKPKDKDTPQSFVRPKGATPISARANINFSPAISMTRSSSRPGKTIINDNLTPNTRSGKTYEFNFELDVSMDANVIVNVKRKKKASSNGDKAEASRTNSSRSKGADSEDTDTPVTRVKVRKLASDEEVGSSPRTPAVTVKKSKRFI